MTLLEEIIQLSEKITLSLDLAAKQEIQFCKEICLELEQYNWEIFRMTNEICEINEKIKKGER